MNGAESLVRTLVANEVEVCFTNPGTSEMHFVAALDKVEGMRCILGLFEGVITGAADGYYRMSGKPASTLLHLGPGLGNGLANLHNAKKASSGIVNIVGEHAGYHIKCDAPLTSDVQGIAAPMSHWVKTSQSSKSVAMDGLEAIKIANEPPGKVATLILPADTAWGEGAEVHKATIKTDRSKVDSSKVYSVANILEKKESTLILLGGIAVREDILEIVGRIASKTNAKILSENNNSRMQRGVGRVRAQQIPYVVDKAVELLKDFKNIILIGAKSPVAFFAYPNKPSYLAPSNCEIIELAAVDECILDAVQNLEDIIGCKKEKNNFLITSKVVQKPFGQITDIGIAQVLALLIPEGAIIVDESITVGRVFDENTYFAKPHDWLNIMGGSIGFGLPCAVGAATACPDRPVIVLEGDGSAMYTNQSLWTMARENLNVKVLIFSNQAYKILQGEFNNVGAGTPGKKAESMLSLNNPTIDWVSLGKGHGVSAKKVFDLTELFDSLKAVLSHNGPDLIEVCMV
jgi:acetolactate synthase I/II/III large subunit